MPLPSPVAKMPDFSNLIDRNNQAAAQLMQSAWAGFKKLNRKRDQEEFAAAKEASARAGQMAYSDAISAFASPGSGGSESSAGGGGRNAPRALPGVNVGELSDVELLARTLQAEAGNQDDVGLMAVGSVIANRVKNKGYGNTLRDVIMQDGQFSAWNGVTGYAGGEQGQNMNFTPEDRYLRAAQTIIGGQYEDITGGATHYYNPKISNPNWGQKGGGTWTPIGDHLFGWGN